MPYWGEWMPESMRWDAIRFLMGSYMMGKPAKTDSVYNDGMIASNYLTASSQVFLDEGHSIPTERGPDLYQQYCTTCHGDAGLGNGPGTMGNASGGPAPFPRDMGEAYIFWRTNEGVPESNMYPFQWVMTSEEMWAVTLYVDGMTSSSQGGN